MKQVCAWCMKVIGETPSVGEDENVISHGMCDECALHLEAQGGMPLREYLEKLEGPVLLVDADGKVISANSETSKQFGMTISEIEGSLCGEVFECKHSLLKAGCGRTVHCLGCAIRKCVEHTHKTGEPCKRIPAHLSRTVSDTDTETRFLVSTEKAGNLILLRIEPA